MRFVFGDCELDTERYELRRAGQVVALEPMALRVLAYLLRQSGRAVTKQDLLQTFWPGTSEATYKECSLRNCLMKIRQAVGDMGTPRSVIETIRGTATGVWQRGPPSRRTPSWQATHRRARRATVSLFSSLRHPGLFPGVVSSPCCAARWSRI